MIIALLLAYVIGCLTTGYYLVRWRLGTDVRDGGSRRVGAWNVMRLLGQRGFWITFIGDFAKGALAIAVARWLDTPIWVQATALVVVIIGHNYPVQLGFRGGNGLAAGSGALAMLDPVLFLGFFVLVLLLFPLLWPLRRFGVPIEFHSPSQFVVIASPLLALAFGRHWSIALALFVAAVLLLGTARKNMIILGEYDGVLRRRPRASA